MSYEQELRNSGEAFRLIGEALDQIIANTTKAQRPVFTELTSTDVRQVYDHWARVMDKRSNAKLTPERRRDIQRRLKEGYTVADMCKAIDGCARSDFHMARGEHKGGKRHNDLTLILRNGSKLEGFRDFAEGGTPKGAFL